MALTNSHEDYITKLLGERLRLLSQVKKIRNEERDIFEYIIDRLDSNAIVINNNSTLVLNFDPRYIIDDTILNLQMRELIRLLKQRITDTDLQSKLSNLVFEMRYNTISKVINPIAHEIYNRIMEAEQRELEPRPVSESLQIAINHMIQNPYTFVDYDTIIEEDEDEWVKNALD
jgi:hypothetical protein